MTTSTSLSSSQQLIMEQQQEAVNTVIDNSKENTHKLADEQITQNSRLVDGIKGVQKLSAEALGDILDAYLKIAGEYTKALGPVWSSQTKDAYNTFNPKAMAQRYSKIAGAYADNAIAMSRVTHDVLVATTRVYSELSAKQASNFAKGLSEIGSNIAKSIKP